MKAIMILIITELIFVCGARAEIINVPCEEFNKTTGDNMPCEEITGGTIKIDEYEYEKYQNIYQAKLKGEDKKAPASLPRFEADPPPLHPKKVVITPEMKELYCKMPIWYWPEGLKCDK